MADYSWIPKIFRLEDDVDEVKNELQFGKPSTPQWLPLDSNDFPQQGFSTLPPQPWYQGAIEAPGNLLGFLGEGLEQTVTMAGSLLTGPFRPAPEDIKTWEKIPPIYIKEFYKGGRQYEAYEEWRDEGKDPHIPALVPSWKQLGAWLKPILKGNTTLKALGVDVESWDEPEKYDMAKLGMAETAEFAPWLLLGVGKGAKTLLEKAGDMVTKEIGKGVAPEVALNKTFNTLARKGKLPTVKPEVTPQQAGRAELGGETTTPAVNSLTKAGQPPTPNFPNEYALSNAPQALIPEQTITHTFQQLKDIHNIKAIKKLGDAQYRRILKLYTGKNSAKFLTREEADNAIKALTGIRLNAQGKAVVPKTTNLVPKDIIDQIPYLKDIGFHDVFRQKLQVLRLKFGTWGADVSRQLLDAELQYNRDLLVFRNATQDMAKLIGNSPISKTRIFNAVENPLESHLLDPAEQQVFRYFKGFFDDWANRLNLSASQRRQNYVTHIFEQQMKLDIDKKKTPAMELMAALDFNASENVFNPFLRKRMGLKTGVKKDPFAAADVYEYYALKKTHYEPLIRKITAYAKMIRDEKPMHFKYLDDVAKRISGRPSSADISINKSFNMFVDNFEKVPGINKLIPQQLKEISTRGNFASLIAYNMNSMLYTSWLGFRPVSAIRNLSQQLLAVADNGAGNFAKGVALRSTKEGKEALSESLVYQGRLITKQAVAGLEDATLNRLPKNLQNWALGLFKFADKQNVADSFLAGYSRGKSLGLPREWAIKLADETAMDTQYIYTKMARSLFEESVLGRFAAPFTSWPRNFLELMGKWTTGRPSLVLREYEKQTGKKLISENWLARHRELMTYAAILTGAYVTEANTPLRAVEYTGWTSVRNLANMLSGDLPALAVPGNLAKIVAGTMSGDTRMAKEGMAALRPDRFVLITKQLEDIVEGKQDWLSLFFFLDRAEMDEKKKEQSRTKSKAGSDFLKGKTITIK